jgi:aryl-alcohol dehydrogenase-like predicted oxidoreductase
MELQDTATHLGRRPLGRTGLAVSPLTLANLSMGSMRTPSAGLGADEVERAFHEHGVNTFFVPPGFHALCQGVQRLVRAGHRDELVLVSMASLPFGWSVRRAWTKAARALGVEHIDVFLLGWVQARWYVTGQTWKQMRRLQSEGKVRALGFSCHKRTLAAELGRELDVDVLMIRYNAAHRGAEREVFAALEPLGGARPGIIAYTVTRWGTLLQPLPEAGFPHGMTAPECYRFALSHAGVDTVLCAPRSAAELHEDVSGVLCGALGPERLEQTRSFGDAVHASGKGGAGWMFR